MRLVLFLLVLACALRAESIPITGSLNEVFGGTYDGSVGGPGLAFSIGDPMACLLCGDPGVGDCTPGTICGFNYGWGASSNNTQGDIVGYAVTYHGISIDPTVVPSSVFGNFSLSTTGELYTGQSTLIEPVTLSGEIEASLGSQQFLDLFVSGSGTAQIFVGSLETINDPNHVYGIDVNFTGTASTSPVPEPKSAALVILSMAGVLAFLKTRLRS